jgi:hypothetical protein
MALAKSIDQPTGVAVSYHRVVRGIVDFVTGATTLEVASYLDAAARTAGKTPIGESSLTIPSMPDFNGDPRPWAYAQLKARPEWAGATDV